MTSPKPETPLPWEAVPDDTVEGAEWCIESNVEGHEPIVACMLQPSDAKYIVHAANSLPALEHRVAELEAALQPILENLRSVEPFEKPPEYNPEYTIPIEVTVREALAIAALLGGKK